MAQFSVNPSRFDPYKNFKFRVKWDGRYIAGVSKVSALRRTTEVVEHREGSDPSVVRKSPGQTRYEPITLERGITFVETIDEWRSERSLGFAIDVEPASAGELQRQGAGQLPGLHSAQPADRGAARDHDSLREGILHGKDRGLCPGDFRHEGQLPDDGQL